MSKLKITTFLFSLLLAPFYAKAALPEIALAKIYNSKIDVTKYLVSEKFDGVRAYWDGQNLISKNGNIYHAPNWFFQDFPNQVFEGELWIARGKFEEVSGIVRSEQAGYDWQKVKLMIFDLPKHDGTFAQRFQEMQILVEKSGSKYLQVIDQFLVKDEKELMQKLQQITKNGGEGLMLHRAESYYKSGRTNDILKLKTYEDAEAKVLKHLPGKGKYQGMLGAILVENEEGVQFKIGSGFSDQQRQNPPAIGSIITYKFYGKTKNNKPKFASFLRVRQDYEFKEIDN